MSNPDSQEKKLLYRYDRYSDGSIKLARPYVRGKRDDLAMLGEDCLAFDQDLSGLPSDKLEEYLAFENAYVRFYRLWTGSFSLPLGVSRALDRVQSAIEGLRSELSSTLEPPTRAVDFEKVDS